MTKYRVEELNPLHKCTECGVEHWYIEPMTIPITNPEGQRVNTPLLPIEVVLVADGFVTFTTDREPLLSSTVPLVAMLWGIPGNQKATLRSVLVLN